MTPKHFCCLRGGVLTLAVMIALLTGFAAPARAQLVFSPDKVLIRCNNGHCTGATTTLRNEGPEEVTIYSLSIGGSGGADWSQTNNCGSALAPGASCQINLTVAPGSGNATAILTATDSAPNSPQKAFFKEISYSSSWGNMGMVLCGGIVPVKINGALPNSMDGAVRTVLRRALDARPEAFVVHISKPHSDLVIHIQQPFDKKLKFSSSGESEIARELYTTVTEIAEGELGPTGASGERRS